MRKTAGKDRKTSETEDKAVLKRVIILSDLTDDELGKIWGISSRVEIPAGSVIMTEGEMGDTMFFFVQGEVDVTKNLTLKIGRKDFGSAEKSMVKLKAEHVSFFGDMALLQKEPRSASITASTDCVLYEINRDDFIRICDENPTPGLKVLRRIATTLCDRVRKGNEDVLKLTTALSIALAR